LFGGGGDHESIRVSLVLDPSARITHDDRPGAAIERRLIEQSIDPRGEAGLGSRVRGDREGRAEQGAQREPPGGDAQGGLHLGLLGEFNRSPILHLTLLDR